MNKIITMTDSKYFQYGRLFLKTRHKINSDVVCYGCDLTKEQIKILGEYDIIHREIKKELFESKMQYLKFQMIGREAKGNSLSDGIAFCDWDTFFCKSLGNIFNKDFDLGITYRKDMIEKNCLRAFSNGGVIFGHNNNNTVQLCLYAMGVMINGRCEKLPEYDEIWKTLEIGRRPEKTHYRTNLRWWVDQVFLSSLALRHCRNIKTSELSSKDLDFNGLIIKFFDCDKYNVLESEPIIKDIDTVYIRHLKTKSGAPVEFKG